MEEKALARVEPAALRERGFTDEERDLIKRTFAPTLTDLEFDLFLYTAKSVGLNPIRKQIYAVKRKTWNPETRAYEERMSIQTGIDGFRSISFENNTTLPGREPTFTTNEKLIGPKNPAGLESATAYLKIWGKDNQYHEVSATAYYDEYCQTNKDGFPIAMWKKMPRVMLAKCAEAILHRKCNPERLGGIYTSEEMAQADNHIEPGRLEGYTSSEEVDTKSLPEKTVQTEIVDTTEGPAEQGVLIEAEMDKKIEETKEVFPDAKVVSKQKKGKYGFLDEVRKLKTELKKLTGTDEAYYNVLGVIGPGSYTKSSDINDRQEQIAFFKGLKSAVAEAKERE